MTILAYLHGAGISTILTGIFLLLYASSEIARGRTGSRAYYKALAAGTGCCCFGPALCEFLQLVNTPAADSTTVLIHFINSAGLLATGGVVIRLIAAFEYPEKGLGKYWPAVASACAHLTTFAHAKAQHESKTV